MSHIFIYFFHIEMELHEEPGWKDIECSRSRFYALVGMSGGRGEENVPCLITRKYFDSAMSTDFSTSLSYLALETRANNFMVG